MMGTLNVEAARAVRSTTLGSRVSARTATGLWDTNTVHKSSTVWLLHHDAEKTAARIFRLLFRRSETESEGGDEEEEEEEEEE